MGATPDQVLSIAMMLAFAADQRESGFGTSVGAHPVEGELTASDGLSTPIAVRDILNKIIHGRPSKVEVLENGSG